MRIQLNQVSFSYLAGTDFSLPALIGVDLKIDQGECIGIIGPTGSGKSTLAQILNGLLHPTSGEIYIDGDFGRAQAQHSELIGNVGLVFQFPESQLFGETIAADVAFGPTNLGLSKEEISNQVRMALDAVGLDYDTYHSRSPFGLSGGEKRLAAIAGIIAMQPEVLIFDEPTSGLDEPGRIRIFDLLKKLHSDGKTVILISHDINEIADIAKRLILLCQGHIVMDGDPEWVFSNEIRLLNTGLEIPTTLQLTSKLRAKGLRIEGRQATTSETVSAIVQALKEKEQS